MSDKKMETNALSLIIKEKTLGTLVTNAKELKQHIEKKLKEYSLDNYQAGDEKKIAKDRAELNAAEKDLNARRLELEREWNLPFLEFKTIINETTSFRGISITKRGVSITKRGVSITKRGVSITKN